jgi:CubicO group peptidase (beta-lactamase class C family)
LKKFINILGIGVLGSAVLAVLAVAALWVWPPDLIRIGANYAAKIVCSNVFLAGREPDEVLEVDVLAAGNPLLRLMRVSVDRDQGIVRSGLFGFIGDGLAVTRSGTGCTVLPDGNLAARGLSAPGSDAATPATPTAPAPATDAATPTTPALPATPAAPAAAPHAAPAPPAVQSTAWPQGEQVSTDPRMDRLIADEALDGPGWRAIVVVHRGRIVAERYAPGFSAATPLLGWSMAKSVTAGLIGLLVKDGRLSLDQSAGWPSRPGDGRDRIRISDLLSMTSGLRFNETYGAVSDVTRMLYLEPDMARFAHDQPLAHPVEEVWSYSSGTALILSRIFQDAAGARPLEYVRHRLFDPLGMSSATFETDEHGTLVGSSYLYATARDWARYGLLLADGGMWQGQELLPPGYVHMMATPVAASGGQYGHGQVWLWGSDPTTPGLNPDAAFGIPADTFWMEGHDGQSVAIIPSRELVVVRMGLTPSEQHYLPQGLVQAALQATVLQTPALQATAVQTPALQATAVQTPALQATAVQTTAALHATTAVP